MQETNAKPHANSQSSAPKEPHRARRRSERGVSWERRLLAAGIRRGDDPPENIDAFRYSLARRIAMFINDWHGCPERLCRRQRGCMAPHNTCANRKPSPPRTPEEDARLSAFIARFYRTVAAQQGEG